MFADNQCVIKLSIYINKSLGHSIFRGDQILKPGFRPKTKGTVFHEKNHRIKCNLLHFVKMYTLCYVTP